MESYATMSWKLVNPYVFELWHDCLSHLGSTMMCRIIENLRGHLLWNTKVLLSKDYSCETSSQGKLITQPFITNVNFESLSFLQRIQNDICGLKNVASGPFTYFMLLVDASKK